MVSSGSGNILAIDLYALSETALRRDPKTGDELIIRMSEALAEISTSPDFRSSRVYRVGGNEFCVVLPSGCDPEEYLKELDLNLRKSSHGRNFSPPKYTWALVRYGPDRTETPELLASIWVKLSQNKKTRHRPTRDLCKNIAERLFGYIEETVELLSDMGRLAYTDDVSGLPNSRAARYAIKQCLSKCELNGGHLSLLFVDGDNLRLYNDNLGYSFGNEMIRKLGAILSAETSPGDLVTRWLSGDEFMIIKMGATKEEAIAKANEICSTVREQSVSWIYPVSVSIGVVTYPEDGRDSETLIKRVEEANLQAKRAGKNRVSPYRS